MKIHPMDMAGVTLDDALAGFNTTPNTGDTGHVDDHGRLAKALFDVPQKQLMIGAAFHDPEGWTLIRGGNTAAEPERVTWQVIREMGEQVGVLVMGANTTDMGHNPAADGETDWADDAEFDDLMVYMYANGIVGLSHAVTDLSQRLAALESAQSDD